MTQSSRLASRARSLEKSSFYQFFQELVACSEILKQISPGKRRPWIASVVRELYDEQKGKCSICKTLLRFGKHEVDHIIPFCYGGGNERKNLQITCRSCNRTKRKNVRPNDLLRYLEDRYMNR
ncbi:MAG: HNH endonuclease [Nitrospinota bacterium]